MTSERETYCEKEEEVSERVKQRVETMMTYDKCSLTVRRESYGTTQRVERQEG